MITIEEKLNSKVPGTSSLYISFEYNKDIVEALKNSVTVANYDKKSKVWEVPVTDLASIINSVNVFDDIELKLKPDEKKHTVKDVQLSEFKTTPFPYQAEGIKFGLSHDKWLLLDAPGLGKTLQMLYLALELKKREGIEHCLIICGVNNLKFNWKREIEKHTEESCYILGQRITKSGKFTIGSVNDRVADLNRVIDEFFVVTNIETLRDANVVKGINKGANKFDLIIIDEVHRCKNPTAVQSKNFLKLTSAKYRVALTGTLLLNSPLDAYIPLKWIGKEHCSFSNFKYYYCNYTGFFNNDFVGYRNVDTLKEQLNECSLRRTKDLLDLPEKTIITQIVEMNPTQETFYSNIQAGIVDQVDKVDMSTANILSMVARLRQATECPSVLTTENIKSEKVSVAEDLVEQIVSGDEKVVVFSTFKETLNTLKEDLKQYKPLLCTGDVPDVIINENIEKFQNDDEHMVMLCTTSKMGTGVTLNRATHAIFISNPWTAADCQQCEDRIHRIGSKKPVFIHYLISNNTIDQRVDELVHDKGAISDYIIDDKIEERSIDSLRKYIQGLTV